MDRRNSPAIVIWVTEGRSTLRNNPLTARLTWIEADTRPAARSFPDGHWRFDNALVSKPVREGPPLWLQVSDTELPD